MPRRSSDPRLLPLESVRAADLARCEVLLRAGSKSFSLAARFLPKPIRDRTTILYAFCRTADDCADDDPNASLRTIDAMRERLRRAYLGAPNPNPVDRALAGLLEDTSIPPRLLEGLLEGMEWDVRGRRYVTFEDLEGYAERVAGTVGAMMT